MRKENQTIPFVSRWWPNPSTNPDKNDPELARGRRASQHRQNLEFWASSASAVAKNSERRREVLFTSWLQLRDFFLSNSLSLLIQSQDYRPRNHHSNIL
jgi:hypothetical protein